MVSYTIAEISLAHGHLLTLLRGGGTTLRLGEDDALDACGAQLLACAVASARSRGRSLTLEMPAEGAAATLWRALALDSVCTPVATPATPRAAGAAPEPPEAPGAPTGPLADATVADSSGTDSLTKPLPDSPPGAAPGGISADGSGDGPGRGTASETGGDET